ncbi:MAG: ATP-binding protein [Candidatus Pacebacteria bacterium]|nr:ATP-binding protein [Candidatus Paceibacterota bacterium]
MPEPLTQQTQTIPETLAPAAMSVSSNSIQIGPKFARTIFLATYPRYLNTNWLSPIINLDRAFDASIFVHPKSTAEVLKKLRDQLARLQAQAIEEASQGKVRDPILETAMADIETLRDKLQQGTDKFFELGVYITIYENSVKELDETESKIKGFLEYQLIFAKPATFRMMEGFNSTLPTDDDQLNVHTSLNTEPLSSLFPFVSFDLTSNSGILYGINTHNNSLVLFDRFKLENYNSVVFGKSGGGKSYTIKLEILRSLVFGTQVLIIDPEDEYKYLADTVGGSPVKISINSDQHINPFDLPAPKEGEIPADIFRSHILDLSGLMKLILGDLTPEESAILDEALIQTYAIKDISPDSDFTKTPPPVLGDLQNILEGLTGAESMATRLKKYTSGTFAGFLNQPTNVPLDNQMIVFGIRDMEEELRPIAMYLILNFIWVKVRRDIKQRIILVDEAWVLMKYEVGANFLSNIAKRCRKYFTGLTTISQDIPDFLASPQGKTILTNSSIQILMKQSPAAIDIVQQTFNLTDAEKFYILEARVGFGLFFLGQNHIGIRIVASYAEDQIITSDPRQILEIEKAKEEWANIQK